MSLLYFYLLTRYLKLLHFYYIYLFFFQSLYICLKNYDYLALKSFSPESSHKLEKLTLIAYLSSCDVMLIAENLLNLKHLALDISTLEDDLFDSSSLRKLFENLTLLKYLSLRVRADIESDIDSDDELDYINIGNLRNLEYIMMEEMYNFPEIKLKYLAELPHLKGILYASCYDVN